jgi:alpha-glucosidase
MASLHSVTPASIGSLAEVIPQPHGFSADTGSGHLLVSVYHPHIIRVQLSQHLPFENFSYAVIAQPQSHGFNLDESSAQLALSTTACRLVIHKSPCRFSFQTSAGDVLNEDDFGLGTAWIGEQVTAYKKLQEGERFIGLGEKTGGLDRRGAAYQNWNTDAYGYHGGSDPLYCSTPFYIGMHNGKVYGIFFDNSHKTHFNFGASNNRFASFSADAGEMNYYLISGQTVADIIEHYTFLTGRMEMPPLWSIGYQQCRYSYYPDKEVYALARTFREKDIPADVIVLDIHYMEKYKIFTWDGKNFPDPKALIDHLKNEGFRVVVICDPGIKAEAGYHTYDSGMQHDAFLKYPDGSPYTGQVWPGWCHFPDFTKAAARSWWHDQLKLYTDAGIEGFWNDMNEIATWGNALPENIVFDFEGELATTRRGRNVYGLLMSRASAEGAARWMNGRRPFTLTRAAYAGIQRYAAVWTGDNVSYDEHMLLGVRLVNSLGLTGIAFAGYDAGGFVGDCNPKLFARWISIAALSPFFRAHTMINTRDSEPWSYGEEVEQIARNFIKLRYQLMPYLYSLFYEASVNGMPVQRSLALNYTFDSRVYDGQYNNQYLLGAYILVAPVESTKTMLKVLLPPGIWYSVYTGEQHVGDREIFMECPIHRLPVFIKEGALLPTRKAGINTASERETLILHVYYSEGASSFLFYEDDGETYQYREGSHALRMLTLNGAQRQIRVAGQQGNYPSPIHTLDVVLHGFPQIYEVQCNGLGVSVHAQSHSFFTPLEKYDPIHDPEWMGVEQVQRFSVNYTSHEVTIGW